MGRSFTPEEARAAGLARHGLTESPFPAKNGLSCAEHRRAVKAASRHRAKQRNRARVSEERQRRGDACERCGTGGYLEWHHRDRDDVQFRIGGGGKSVSTAAIEAELAKCDLLCVQCHVVADALYVVTQAVESSPRWRAEVALLLDGSA